LFADDIAAQALLQVIDEVMYETRTELYGFVIMPDHVHLALRVPPGDSTGRVMGKIKGRFAHRWNHREGSFGPVWQRRFHERVLVTEAALEAAVLYVHMNPVAAGITDRMEDYRWSSAYDDDSGQAESLARKPEATRELSVYPAPTA
jgi:putative transposase